MGKFIKHDEASKFLNSIQDDIVRSLIISAYQTHLLSNTEVDGEFDLLYFFRILEEFLRDREKIAKSLKGDFEDELSGWGS